MSLTLKMENALNHEYKNNNGRNFQFTKFSFIDFFLTDRRSLSGKRPKSARGNSFSCRFSSHWMRNFRFLTEYWFSSHSRKFWTSMSVSDTKFFCVLAAIIRESPDKVLSLRIVKALPFIHQPGQVAPKASDVSAADWLYQHTHVKKYDIFSRVLLRLFSGPGNPCITPQFMKLQRICHLIWRLFCGFQLSW